MQHRRLQLILCLFLVAATLFAYWQVWTHDFVNFDDGIYVTENPRVRTGLTLENVVWAFTTTDAEFWHPLTWISHMLDCQLYGLHPGGHHVTNLVLHMANTLLLFLVLRWMTGAIWASAFVAALFALHPLHVESVAWVAERKDVLSTLFWMLTMAAYHYYTESPGVKRYLLVSLAFVMGLMAKPMLVTLPFVLLLLDYWPLGRVKLEQRSSILPLLLEKIPLLALTACFCALTFLAQQKGGLLPSLDLLSVQDRLANALVSYVSYIGMMMWPGHLAVYYHQSAAASGWQALLCALCLGSISTLVVLWRQERPYLAVGWLWYLGTLVPVIGLVQIATFTMADRYTYVPLIGLFMMIAWGLPDLLPPWKYQRMALLLSAGIVVLAFTARTRSQVRHWENSVSLWKQTANATDNNYSAYNCLGAALIAQGRFEEGIAQLSKALGIKPDYAEAYINLGDAMARQGRLDEARAHFSTALKIDPDYVEAMTNLGLTLCKQGKPREALDHFAAALSIKPDYAEAHNNMGGALSDLGRLDEAIEHYSKALQINPHYAEACNNMGLALARQGHLDEAIEHYSKALQVKPGLVEAHNNKGIALASQGRLKEAIDCFSRALKFQRDNIQLRDNLQRALRLLGNSKTAPTSSEVP